MIADPVPSVVSRIKQPDEKTEGENLALVGMAGQLQVESTFCSRIDQRSMLKQQSKSIFRHAGRQLCLSGLVRLAAAGGIVDAGDGDLFAHF